MSICYWGIMIHGVVLDDLKWKEDAPDFDKIMNDELEVTITLPNRRSILLSYEPTDDKSYFGLFAGYPWYERFQGLTKQSVDDAIVQFLSPYLNMTEEEVREKIDDISTYNCG